MIKLIIFDLSGVCYSEEDSLFFKDFSEKYNLDSDEVKRMFDEMIPDSERDDYPITDIYKKIFNHYNIDADPDLTLLEHMNFKFPDDEMLEMVKKLRENYKVAFLTNYSRDGWEKVNGKLKISDNFDYGIASYQIKERKPAVSGFKKIMEHFNVEPEETIYTDDTQKYTEKVREYGINTVHFRSKEQFVEYLKSMGVEIE